MFASLSRRRVIVLVVLTCLLLITLDKSGNPVIERVRSAFSTLIMRPIDAATNAIVLPLERAWDGIMNYDDVQRERDALYDQVQHMRGNDVEAQATILEFSELIRVFELAQSSSYDSVVAKVVGGSPSNFQDIVEINVGSQNGVKVGMPVTDGAGIIGRITEVFSDHSIVLLATDPTYAIAAEILATPEEVADEIDSRVTSPPDVETNPATTSTTEALPFDEPAPGATTTTAASTTTAATTTTILQIVRETGTLEGQGTGRPLILRFTDSSSAITTVRIGSIVQTAGGNNSLAPQGYPIGIVTNVFTDTGSSSSVIEVTLNARLDRLNFVAVVLYEPNLAAVGN